MPFVNLSTAEDGMGNGNIEGGIILPFTIALPEDFLLGLMAEFGFNRNAGFANFNGDEDYRGAFDAGLTCALIDDVQLDTGIRVGLTEAAEGIGVFADVSFRF